ncbi:hypothetical protein ACRE2Q_11105 [Streptococcus pneumoniae]
MGEKRNHPGSKLRQGFWMVFRLGVNNWGIKLGQFYGISHKVMLYRLRNDGYLDAEEIKNMDISVIETASRLGYDTSLYRPLSESKKEMSLG